MKSFVCLLLIPLFFISCQDSKKSTEREAENALSSIEGTWVLKKYKDQDSDKPDEWVSYGDEIIYEKYITPTHFVWVSYDQNTMKLTGAGGGTYEFDGSIYKEDIKFFYPPGSNELGQAIPFTHEMKGGEWYHTGYAKIMDMDINTGDMIQVDSMKIEEIWERTTAEANTTNPEILGSWNLASYRDETDSSRQEYPDFIKYMKLITPTHFVWVQYDGEGDMVYGLGAGPYNFQNGKYVESIQTIYPNGPQQQGTVVPFDMVVEEDMWKHVGYVILRNQDKNGETVTEPLYIDEEWERFENSM